MKDTQTAETPSPMKNFTPNSNWWMAVAESREPDMTLPDYLDRWVLSSRVPRVPIPTTQIPNPADPYYDFMRPLSESGSVFLHRMTGPDEPCLHTHPFEFDTFMLEGGYVERYATVPYYVPMDPQNYRDEDYWDHEAASKNWRLYREGQGGRFPITGAHYIEELTANETWTLVVTGPKLRSWGFFKDGRYWPHEEYLAKFSTRPEPIMRHGYKV